MEFFWRIIAFAVVEGTTDLNLDRNFDDTWHFALGFQYRIEEPWLISVGIAYDESPVSDSNRTPDMPLDRQWRYATGIQYDLSEDMTIGCAYEFLDAGDAEISQIGGRSPGRSRRLFIQLYSFLQYQLD